MRLERVPVHREAGTRRCAMERETVPKPAASAAVVVAVVAMKVVMEW